MLLYPAGDGGYGSFCYICMEEVQWNGQHQRCGKTGRSGSGETVSRALNGTGYVSPDTKKKIENAAEKLGYTPNELARNLYRNRTGIVGVMVPDLDHPFFSPGLAKHIEMETLPSGI